MLALPLLRKAARRRAEDESGERLLGVCRAKVQEGCTGARAVNARHGALDRDGLPHV